MRPLKLSTKPFCIGLPGAMKCHSSDVAAPGEHRVRGELGAVIADDHARLAMRLVCRQLAGHTPARDRGVGDGTEALLGDVVDDVEDAKAPAASELVVDEVDRPARIRLRLHEDRRPGADGLSASSRLRTAGLLRDRAGGCG